MAVFPNPYTAHWFARLFHECSQSLAQWEALAAAKSAECNELQYAIQTLQKQKKDIAAEKAFYDQMVAEQATVLRSSTADSGALDTHSGDRVSTRAPPRASYQVVNVNRSQMEALEEESSYSTVSGYTPLTRLHTATSARYGMGWDVEKRLCHGNLVTPVAFYSVSDDVYVVHEYQGESLFDLPPLPVRRATSMAFQVIDAIYYLVRSGVAFRIRDVSAIHLPSNLEIVLDWNVETDMEPTLRAANLEYVADDFATLARRLRLESAPLVVAVLKDLQRDIYVPA
ncbi:hypothetical protein NLG97_g3634 [Lecanicillium saksenae]|uniref:Uncharacterized protein n=1 Tax=Lecanicillium saksenae TaxID=468837 RepID=A0ACC1QY48_9HYPO|nr:hypothetical protein NLG97_g3634 [Lecanicillium saksenae]